MNFMMIPVVEFLHNLQLLLGQTNLEAISHVDAESFATTLSDQIVFNHLFSGWSCCPDIAPPLACKMLRSNRVIKWWQGNGNSHSHNNRPVCELLKNNRKQFWHRERSSPPSHIHQPVPLVLDSHICHAGKRYTGRPLAIPANGIYASHSTESIRAEQTGTKIAFSYCNWQTGHFDQTKYHDRGPRAGGVTSCMSCSKLYENSSNFQFNFRKWIVAETVLS